MRLDCRNAQKMIAPFLDDELDDHDCASFLNHVRSCPRCMEELETFFMITYALEYLDDESNRSFDIKELLRERLYRSDRKLSRHQLFSFFLWMLIIALGVAIVLLILMVFFPQFLPETAATLRDQFFSLLPL
ncbi:MAG: zf-HC2 domain-containing protein [Lachnospiraceae bacterium]|nr:zf-HC2 domain-containing protein [Lachnospiraceae bacterium]